MDRLAEGVTLADRFRLERRIGSGGMGEVWLASDHQLGEPVALKILDPGLAAVPGYIDLLRAECRKARGLVHPNIVRVYDFHTDGAHRFISMQWVDGDSLVALRGGPFQEIVAAALMVCDALEYAHRQGLVHRDLKPGNVLRDRHGVCYLADFGIAATMTESGPRGGGSLPGTSPQQLAGEPPAVADDVYGLGALLYELLSGAPLFHPDPSPERIRQEPVPPLSVDGRGAELPGALRDMVAATLEKLPERRPAGVAAVRAVLEEVHADLAGVPQASREDGLIRPVRREGGSHAAAPAAPRSAHARPGLPVPLVAGGLAVLLAVALGVVFYLPDVVRERGPLVDSAPVEPPRPAAEEAVEPASAGQRELADEVLGEYLALEDDLRARGAERWGGTDWAEARRLAGEADDRYRSRDFAAAAAGYRLAHTLLKVLEPRGAQVLADALAAGEQALADGLGPEAAARFELALAVDGDNVQALAGLERAQRLDEVLALTARGDELAGAGDLAGAITAYGEALAIDPGWTPADSGLDRARSLRSQGRYETSMAEGFAALSRQDFDEARRAFEAALATRPGDAEARRGLTQTEAEQRLARVVALEQEARLLEAREQWPEAAARYEAALAIDENLASARQGLDRSRSRAALGGAMADAIARADQLNDEAAWQRAKLLLDRARAIESPGPVLERQAADLDAVLRVAAIPVAVSFESDNLTEVMIYKVGRLGTFDRTTVDLRPGRYVAVGSRDGFRDIRLDFRVAADGTTPPVVVRCEDPI
jgi:hypothetical protein